MRIGLHDAEREHMPHKTFPNLALMKIAAYHKAAGDDVEWWNPLYNAKYDRVYSSKVFDYTPDNLYLPPCTIRGGSGYRDIPIDQALPPEIDDMSPDYSIYPDCDYAIGYITRGCPNHCRWCIVPEKEGAIRPYKTWGQLIRSDSDKLVLMDNNILACNYGVEQLESMIGSGYSVDLNQGMDARLIDSKIANILAHLTWIKYIRMSCDSRPQIQAVMRAADLLGANGIKPYRLFVYLLVTRDVEDAAYRVEQLKRLAGINIYAQAERNTRLGITPNKLQLEFAQRYVYSKCYRAESWYDYLERHKRRLTI